MLNYHHFQVIGAAATELQKLLYKTNSLLFKPGMPVHA